VGDKGVPMHTDVDIHASFLDRGSWWAIVILFILPKLSLMTASSILPDNSYCMIVLTFFRNEVNPGPTIIVDAKEDPKP